jgi:putative transposase
VRPTAFECRYEPRPRPADEAVLVEHLQQFAKRRRRRGYRLVHQELCREGWLINHKRVYRLWKEHKLNVKPTPPQQEKAQRCFS